MLAFSGLRRHHRERLRATGLRLRFLFLHGDQTLIAARMQARSGHYMPTSLLDSQFEALEMPLGEADVVTLAIDRRRRTCCVMHSRFARDRATAGKESSEPALVSGRSAGSDVKLESLAHRLLSEHAFR